MKITNYTVLALVAGMVLVSCSEQEEINVYSSRHYDTDITLYDQFKEETGISVNLIEGGSDELIERMNSENVNSPADVLITVDSGRLWRAKEAGVLQAHGSEELNQIIPEELRDIDNMWVGLSKRVRGIIYHKDRTDAEELAGYWDLSDERWKGRICIRSSNNIYNQSLVASLIETHGIEETEEWAEGLVANFARDPQGGDTDQIRAVAAGVCDIAVANHYYLARLITSDDPEDQEVAEAVDIHLPDEEDGGTHVNISGAGVAAHSPNKVNAVTFIEYLATEKAQQLYAIANNEFPIAEGMELPEVLQSFGEFESDAVNVTTYGENNPDAIRLMDRAGWR